ncbi:MAG: serine protease [Verrucomicrobiota bacterium]
MVTKFTFWSLCLVAIVTASCVDQEEVDKLRFDNPEMRERQNAYIRQIIPDPKEAKVVRNRIGARVELVGRQKNSEEPISKKNFHGLGRIVAISPDGYFLTAAHVSNWTPLFIKDEGKTEAFYATPEDQRGQRISDVAILYTEEEMKRFFYTRYTEGRIVWTSEQVDLAIVKFDKKTDDYFRYISNEPPARGTLLLCADDRGILRIKNNQGIEDGTGNGPFLSAGKALDSQTDETNRSFSFGIDMVSRGGMSGGPIVDQDDNLYGILSQAVYKPSDGDIESIAVMLHPDKILEIIEADRAQNSKDPHRETVEASPH